MDSSVTLTRKRAGIAGVDVHDIARRLGGTLRGEECHGFGHIFRVHAALEQAALAIYRLEFVDALLILGGTLLRPFALPDSRPAQHRVRIDDIDANAKRRAFEREAAREMQLSSLGRAVRSGSRGCRQRVFRTDEYDGPANALRLEQQEGLARNQ